MVVSSSAPPVAAVPDELQAYIEHERRRADVVGVAVAAFDREGIRYAGGFGHADLARGERVTPDTLFRAASISKLFTTTLVLQEVEAGRLGLDDWVNRYLDEATRIRDPEGGPADVTVRQLLTHTSGLPVSWRGLEYRNPVYKRLVNGMKPPRSLEEVVAGTRQMRHAGGPLVYSNGAFALLGHLVARMERRPFEDVVRDRVLRPLGMTRSAFPVAPAGPGHATPYGKLFGGGGGRRPAPYVWNYTLPAGSLVTSALELARFGRMALRRGELDGARVLAEATVEDATRFHARNHADLDEGLGLGFFVAQHRGRRFAGHDGGLSGVATRLALLPDDGAGVVVLTNGGDAPLVSRIAERLLEDLLGISPEVVPGSPRGIAPELAGEWRAFTRRVCGRWSMLDFMPPGPFTLLGKLMAHPKLSHVADGVLALDGSGMETAFLYPDGEVGRFRVAHPMANGRRAVIEERADGTHLWVSMLHLIKR